MLVIIYYKTRSYTILIPSEYCPICNKTDSLQLQLLQQYNEVFSIIRFPIKKYNVLECNACKNSIPESKWNTAVKKYLQDALQNSDSENNTFLWSWLWKVPLALIGGYWLLYLIVYFLLL
jgi:hypothetical protein